MMIQPKNKIPSILLLRQSYENQQQQQLIPQEQQLQEQQQQSLQPQELFKTATFFEPPQSQQSQHQKSQSQKQLPQRNTNLTQVLHINLPHHQEIDTRQILSSRAPQQQQQLPEHLSQHRPSLPNKSCYNSPTNLNKFSSITNQATPAQINPSFTQASHQLNSFSVRKRTVVPFKINQPIQQQQDNEGNNKDIEFWSKVKTIISDPEEILDSKIRGYHNQQDITLPQISINNSSSNIHKKNKDTINLSNQIDNHQKAQPNSLNLNNKKIITFPSDREKIQNGMNSQIQQQTSGHYPKIKIAPSVDLSQSSCSTRDSLRQHSSPQQELYQHIKQDNQALNPLLLPSTPIKNDFPQSAAEQQSFLSSPRSRGKLFLSGSSSSSLAGTFGPLNAPLTNSSKKAVPSSVGVQPNKTQLGHNDTLSSYSQLSQPQSQPYFSGIQNNNLKTNSLSQKRILAISQENPIYHAKKSSKLQEEQNPHDKDANNVNYSNYFSSGSLSRGEDDIFSQQGAPRVIKRTSFLSNEFLKSPSNDNWCLKSQPANKRASQSKISKVTSAPASDSDLYGNYLHTAPDVLRGHSEYNDFNDIPQSNCEFSFCYDKNQSSSYNNNNSSSTSSSKIIQSSSQSCRGQLKKISLLSKQQDNLVKKLFRIDDGNGQSGNCKNSNYLQLTNSQQNLINFNKFKSIHLGNSSNNCN